MKIIVAGPREFDDYDLVKKELDKRTFELDDVILVTDLRPEKETHIDPTSFPVALKWLQSRWRRTKYKNKFCKVEYHDAPFEGEKQWSAGLKAQRTNMVKASQLLILFWEVGNVDNHVESLYKLGKLYDLPIQRIFL